jgi:hypothetical protein
MTRPKKDPATRRTEQVNLRLTRTEHLKLEEAAYTAGIALSEYIRVQALKGRVVVQQKQSLDHAAFDQLRRIGVNLNQLTRLANQTGQMPPDLARTAATLEDFLIRHIDGKAPAPTSPPPAPPKLPPSPDMTALKYDP